MTSVLSTHTTADGEQMVIIDMSYNHLCNTVALIMRPAQMALENLKVDHEETDQERVVRMAKGTVTVTPERAAVIFRDALAKATPYLAALAIQSRVAGAQSVASMIGIEEDEPGELTW